MIIIPVRRGKDIAYPRYASGVHWKDPHRLSCGQVYPITEALAFYSPSQASTSKICCTPFLKFQQVRSVTFSRYSYIQTSLYQTNLTIKLNTVHNISVGSIFSSNIWGLASDFSYSPNILPFSFFVLFLLLVTQRH